jgi:hypothetical protein
MFIDIPIYTITDLQFEEITNADKLDVDVPPIDVRDMEVDKILINTEYIQYIQDSTHGCIIQMIEDQFISTLKKDEISYTLSNKLSNG